MKALLSVVVFLVLGVLIHNIWGYNKFIFKKEEMLRRSIMSINITGNVSPNEQQAYVHYLETNITEN